MPKGKNDTVAKISEDQHLGKDMLPESVGICGGYPVQYDDDSPKSGTSSVEEVVDREAQANYDADDWGSPNTISRR